MPRFSQVPPKGKSLLEKQKIFVETFLRTGNGRQSAIAAGYSPKGAARVAYMMIHENPLTRKMIEDGRAIVQAKIGYGLEQAMKECDEAIAFAKSSPHGANAYVKAVELKAKLNGLIIEKHEIKAPPLTIAIYGFGKAPVKLAPSIDNVEALPPGEPGSIIDHEVPKS